MRPLSHLAGPNDAIAFPVFYALVAPAMRSAARGPLHRARHAGRACHAPVGPGGCAECEAAVEDLLLDVFTRLRSALTGPLPTTRAGQPVRELALIRDHLTSPQAEHEDAAALASALRGPASEGEGAWLRAARAQLVHYPLLHLEERIRRADAVRRGAAARPDRDLRQAAWAAPLRTDPVALDLLVFAAFRARRGTTVHWDIPSDLCEHHGLSPSEALHRMNAALLRLRKLRPAFYIANIDDALSDGVSWAAGYAWEHPAPDTDREAARETVRRLIAETPEEDVSCGTRGHAYRAVLAAICAAGSGEYADPVSLARNSLALTPRSARRLVRSLVVLVAAAGLDWVDQAVQTLPENPFKISEGPSSLRTCP